ncbi:hypothetical protein AB0I50_34020, partial [Streptomyces prunicolor]
MKIARRLVLTAAAATAVVAGTIVSATVGQAATPQPPLRLGVTVPDALKVPDGNKLTGVFLTSVEMDAIAHLNRGRGLWKVAGRSFIVQHLL